MAFRVLDAAGAEALRNRLNADGEFRQVSNDMRLDLSLEIGAQKRLFRFRAGKLESIDRYAPMTETIEIYIRGSEDFWSKLLTPLPPPNFQNLYAGLRFKTCEVLGDSEAYFAYFAALNRLIDIMRECQNA